MVLDGTGRRRSLSKIEALTNMVNKEVDILKKIRHRNVVSFIEVCLSFLRYLFFSSFFKCFVGETSQ
jgi:hypothetical protein